MGLRKALCRVLSGNGLDVDITISAPAWHVAPAIETSGDCVKNLGVKACRVYGVTIVTHWRRVTDSLCLAAKKVKSVSLVRFGLISSR